MGRKRRQRSPKNLDPFSHIKRHNRKYEARNRAEARCIYCAAPTMGKYYCPKCAAVRNAYKQRKADEKRLAMGLPVKPKKAFMRFSRIPRSLVQTGLPHSTKNRKRLMGDSAAGVVSKFLSPEAAALVLHNLSNNAIGETGSSSSAESNNPPEPLERRGELVSQVHRPTGRHPFDWPA